MSSAYEPESRKHKASYDLINDLAESLKTGELHKIAREVPSSPWSVEHKRWIKSKVVGFASRNQTTLFSNLAQDNHLIVTKGAILMNRPNQDAVFSVPQALLPGFRCTTGVQCREWQYKGSHQSIDITQFLTCNPSNPQHRSCLPNTQHPRHYRANLGSMWVVELSDHEDVTCFGFRIGNAETKRTVHVLFLLEDADYRILRRCRQQRDAFDAGQIQTRYAPDMINGHIAAELVRSLSIAGDADHIEAPDQGDWRCFWSSGGYSTLVVENARVCRQVRGDDTSGHAVERGLPLGKGLRLKVCIDHKDLEFKEEKVKGQPPVEVTWRLSRLTKYRPLPELKYIVFK